RQDYLEAIESGDTRHIPQVYLKGYIRTYARYLGLPAGTIEKHLVHAKGSEPVVQSVFTSALPRASDDRWFKATSYVLASVVVIALVWQFTTEAVRFSQGEPVARSADSATEFDAVDIPADVGSKSAKNSTLPAKSHLQASIAPLEDVRRSHPQISRSGAESAWSAIGDQVDSANDQAPVLAAGQQSFSIQASADSWVEIVDGNGRKVEMDLLRAGKVREYVAVAPVRLLLGRAASIQLTHNGEPVNLAPYTRGNVARITLGNGSEDPVDASPLQPQAEPSDQPAADPAEDIAEADSQS
ncbi:MAG TPA: helix-turn-helix domain-containing protein, partial [Xanthomonadales bacterium]|nr:helix-turn-helix domain-containing protein [Xanthomonadales bacterium]